MIPVTKASLKTVNRFPELYKRQALQVIGYEKRDAIRMTADSFVMASILSLIEAFDFGTSQNSTRIEKFVAKLQEIIDTSAEYYDNAVVEGLHNKLKMLGVEYNLR